MNQKRQSHRRYKEIISKIAKTRSHEPNQNYAIAKSYLRALHPDWDEVKLETTVLWDVREYFKSPAR